jgi:hypothetical protein
MKNLKFTYPAIYNYLKSSLPVALKTCFLLVVLFVLSPYHSQAQITSISYNKSSADIQNPDRGFYRHRETMATASGTVANATVVTPLVLSNLQTLKTNENKTIILRLYYLNRFRTANISANYLTAIQTDMNTLRAAGFRAVLRFAYNNTAQTHQHSSDASKAQVLAHIAQLKPVIQANLDVISVLQAGFVGTWGEWFYTHPDFSDAGGNPNYTNRKEVIDALLDMMGTTRIVQIRTPYYKQNMYGTGATGAAAALTPAQAYTNTPVARLGHHNDCFLGSSTDVGTYVVLPGDKEYLEEETKYLPNGGETCTDNAFGSVTGGTYTNCVNAQSEMSRFHFSYLNQDYETTTINRFISEGCFNDIKANLGYRLHVGSGNFTTLGKQSYGFNIDFTIHNDGYAAPFNKRVVELILKNNSTLVTYPLVLSSVDERTWLPNAAGHTINVAAGIGNIPNGTYNLYLNIRDGASSISSNTAYSIQMANTGMWESSTGYNLLRSNISVNNTNSTGTGIYNGLNWFGPGYTLNVQFVEVKAVRTGDNATSITWKAAEDIQNKKYDIQKSIDGINYYTIGTVLPSGLSGVQSYSFIDNDFTTARANYRIRQENIDGAFVLSTVANVQKSVLATDNVTVFPNPVTDQTTVSIHNADKGRAIVEVVSTSGTVVSRSIYNLQQGFNQFNISQMENLPAGMYVLRISYGNEKITKQVAKL